MNTLQKIAVMIAATGMITAAVMPGRQTAGVVTSLFGGLAAWTKTAQGRG